MTLKYEHLLGRQFDIETQNCFTILRDFYRDNWGIELTDYPCPTDWWDKGLDLYMRLAESEGFAPINVHPRDWRPGDVILCALKSSTGNHVLIVLDNGKVLHHLVGQLSCVTSYGGMFRNNTVGVFRHKDVPKDQQFGETVNFRDLLPDHAKRRVEDLEAQRGTEAQAEVGT